MSSDAVRGPGTGPAIPEQPAVAGLTFRGFRGESDYPHMLAIIQGCKEADGQERTDSLDDIVRNYRHLVNCDPTQDMVFVQVGDEVIGYGRVLWNREESGLRRYSFFTYLLPAWRGRGIRRAMLHRCEARLRAIAAGHEATEGAPAPVLEAWSNEGETHWAGLLQAEGYLPVRYGYEMVRPNLAEIPDLALPAGLEQRPARPEAYRTIWAATHEAFRDHWGFSDEGWEEDLANQLEDPDFDPSLWQVAWDGDQVAGSVLAFIDHRQNEEYGRKRGWSEGISVRRPYRRQGVAKALIAGSLRAFKERGMEEAALGVDPENPNGALQLYKSMGFGVVKTFTTYRKSLD